MGIQAGAVPAESWLALQGEGGRHGLESLEPRSWDLVTG